MALITKYHTFSDGYIAAALITAARLNTNWDRLYTLVNGALDQENMAADYWLTHNVATKPSWSSAYEGRLIYSEDTQTVSVATNTAWVDLLVSIHATNHKSGGSDPIRLDELMAPTDVTTLNATSSLHGLLPKLSNVSTEYLNGVGGWVNPKIDDLTQGDDNTDLDSSTTRHGLLRKLSNNDAQFLDGTGAWSVPLAGLFTTVADASSPRVTISNNTSRSTQLLVYTKLKEIKINEAFNGTFNLQWFFSTDAGGVTVYTRAYKNGVAFGSSHSTASEVGETIDETVTGPWVANDLIQIYAYSSGGANCNVSNMKFQYNWQLFSIDSIELATPLEMASTTAVSTTNQDP